MGQNRLVAGAKGPSVNGLFVAAWLVLLDQVAKLMAHMWLLPRGDSITVVPGVLDLTYVLNDGAFFSLLRGFRVGFLLLTVPAVALLLVLLFHKKYRVQGWGYVAVVLLLAGAVGNVIDRALYGYVVDMFEFTFVRFAIFNVADICISCGGVLFAGLMLFGKIKLPWDEKHAK